MTQSLLKTGSRKACGREQDRELLQEKCANVWKMTWACCVGTGRERISLTQKRKEQKQERQRRWEPSALSHPATLLPEGALPAFLEKQVSARRGHTFPCMTPDSSSLRSTCAVNPLLC